jgi:hypothetical protein
MSNESDYDTTEKIVQTEVGFSMRVKSKRGTGTRDQDEVTMSVDMEERPTTEQVTNLARHVQAVMDERRAHQPDGDGDE